MHFGGRALARADRAVEETGPLVGGFGARPIDAVDRLAQPRPVRRPRTRRHRGGRAAGREFLCAPTVVDVVDRLAARRRRRASRSRPARARGARPAGSGSKVRASVKPSSTPGPSSLGLTSNVMKTGPSSESASPEQPSARQNGVS